MTSLSLDALLRLVRKLADEAGARELSDGELLERFLATREEAAFALLVQRHGPMVLSVCRQLLGDLHDAEDAFQATFLVLIRRAGSIRKRGSLASWLYGVARRIAGKARAQAERRRAHEVKAAPPPVTEPDSAMAQQELRAVIEEEVDRLAEKYRAPVVLCWLQGKTQEQAARELGCPKTTLASRLEKAREGLRLRLIRRGITLPAAAVSAALAERAPAALPAPLLLTTIRAAALAATSRTAAAAGVSARVLSLAEGGMPTMTLTRLKIAAVLLLLFGVLAGAVALAYQPSPPAEPAPPQKPGAVVKDPNPPPAPGEANPLDDVLSGKVKLEEVRIALAWYGKGMTIIENPVEASAKIYGNGVAIWKDEKLFKLGREQVVALVKRLRDARFHQLPEQYPPLKFAPNIRQASPPLRWHVAVSIAGMRKMVFQHEGEQLALLAEIAAEVRKLAEAEARKGKTVTNLRDGLDRILKKQLAPEALTVSIGASWSEGHGKHTGWNFQLQGTTAWAGSNELGAQYRLPLTEKEALQVVQILLKHQAWNLPPLLRGAKMYGLPLKVLNHNNGPPDKPVMIMNPDQHQRVEALLTAVRPLQQRVLKEGTKHALNYQGID
jgi:RNA polymerase sigma-70 factor (ECF subfamily)